MAGSNTPHAQAGPYEHYIPSPQEARDIATISEFMCSDNDRVVVRRFQKLNLYNLLYFQHQLVRLDKRISDLEAIWDGDGLAEALPRLNQLLKAYSKSPPRLALNRSSLSVDDTLLTQARLNDLSTPPRRLVSSLRSHAGDCLKPMLHELDPQNGWSELVAPNAVRRGWIHRLVASQGSLQKLFKKVNECRRT